MSEPLARLRAIVAASFAAVPAGVQPDAHAMALSAELDACFATLVADESPVCFADLNALADAFRNRSRALPDEVQQAHFDWLRVRNRWYKLVPGPDGQPRAPKLPPGAQCLAMALVPRLYEQIAELRYALHRRAHPAACDCAALLASGQSRAPRSLELRPLGPSTDGYYFGDAFLCGSCGARWFRGIGDDDRGSIFWQPGDG